MAITRLSNRSTRRQKNEMNVVPYIDVMLVLLVIFMVTAPMITPGTINLPSVGQASQVQSSPVEVQLEEDGQISLRLRGESNDFTVIDSNDVVNQVKQTMPQENTPVVISADGKVPYEQVMQLMDKLRQGGVTSLGLLVNQKNNSK